MMKCLMAIKTLHLDYDDRLRKECLSLSRAGVDVRIMVLEQDNKQESRTVYGDIPAAVISLKSRERYPSKQRLWLKTAELYIHLFRHLMRQRPDVVWVHDMTFAGVVPLLALWRGLGLAKGLVWDQHELPPDGFLASPWKRRLLAWLMNRCQVIVTASAERKTLLEERLGESLRTPLVPLENYPDSLFTQVPVRELPAEVQQWLNGAPYFLAQGGGHGRWRHLDELVEAVMGQKEAKLIVLGGFDRGKVADFRSKYGPVFDEQVRFVDFVPQLDVPIFIDSAVASVIFYKMQNLNWIYCAPNRLFQALSRGVPVVVGQNPPLKSLVERHECGVVVDAASAEDIRRGLLRLLERRAFYHQQAQNISGDFLWEGQSDRIEQILALAYPISVSPARQRA